MSLSASSVPPGLAVAVAKSTADGGKPDHPSREHGAVRAAWFGSQAEPPSDYNELTAQPGRWHSCLQKHTVQARGPVCSWSGTCVKQANPTSSPRRCGRRSGSRSCPEDQRSLERTNLASNGCSGGMETGRFRTFAARPGARRKASSNGPRTVTWWGTLYTINENPSSRHRR